VPPPSAGGAPPELREAVEQIALTRRAQQQSLLVLTVDVDELVAELRQQGERRRAGR
jgi:hypothetical protein